VTDHTIRAARTPRIHFSLAKEVTGDDNRLLANRPRLPNRGFGCREFRCLTKGERVRNDKGHWLGLTRSPVARFNPIRDRKRRRHSTLLLVSAEDAQGLTSGNLGRERPWFFTVFSILSAE
jgi:hypothetical protein